MFQFFSGVEHLLNCYGFYDCTTPLSTPAGTLAGVARVATEFHTAVDNNVFLAIGTTAMVVRRSEDTNDRGPDSDRDVHWSRIIADIEIAGCDKRSDLTQIIPSHADRLTVHHIGNLRL